MRAMELKVWVDGVQRIVCGVTEFTTCQEVVIALAQAIGRTGRYTLIERWRETERHLAPQEKPVLSLNKWGQYASDVQLILQRTGPSASERPPPDGPARVPERGLYRQSLPPLAKLRPPGADRSLRRKEPKRKSLTFTGGARGLRDIFARTRDPEAKPPPPPQHGVSLNLSRVAGGGGGGGAPPAPGSPAPGSPAPGSPAPGSPARELGRLVQLQRERLQALETRLQGCEAELQDWDRAPGEAPGGAPGEEDQGEDLEELLVLEQQVRRNQAQEEEEEFWASELHIQQESERRLRQQLAQLQARLRDCEATLSQYLGRIQSMEAGLEQERRQQDALRGEEEEEEEEEEEVVQSQVEELRAELEVQGDQSSRLETSFRALEQILVQSGRRLQQKEQELELLTKELRQVNLQQFIQQTGAKVTVLPAQAPPPTPAQPPEQPPVPSVNEAESGGSLKRLGSSRQLPSDLRTLQSSASSGLNPEGIYV